MLNQLMSTAAVMITPEEAASEEVLKHCPFHSYIDFYYAARDQFFESQGLVDLQEFAVRDNILAYKNYVAIEELIFREDMNMFWSGGYQLVHCLIDYYDLYTKILGTENFTTEWERLQKIEPMEFGMHAFSTWTSVTGLWMEGKHAEAGKAFASGMFPIKQEKQSNLNWEPLPYIDAQPGEEIAGYVSGTIKMFTQKQNHDDLASCLSNQDTLLEGFHQSAESIQKRYNADIEDGIAHLRTIYLSLGSAAANCQDTTKSQIKLIKDGLEEINADTIIANLAEYEKHVKLNMTKMKMHSSVNEFHDYGMNLADIYITLTKK